MNIAVWAITALKFFLRSTANFRRCFTRTTNALPMRRNFRSTLPPTRCPNAKPFRKELYRMTARIAAQKFQYTNLPSAYCLFDTFGDDETDEVLENALEFRRYSRTLPEPFREQTDRIFARWEENRTELEKATPICPRPSFRRI